MKQHPTLADYSKYSTDDFLADEYFQEWVKFHDPEAGGFWGTFVQQYPDKQEDIAAAKAVLQGLRFPSMAPDESRLKEMWAYIDSQTPRTAKVRRISPRTVALLAAACLAGLLVLAWLQWQPDRYSSFKTALQQTRTITLPDQSQVILNANSSLRYTFGAGWRHKRELWLQGEGFFSVARLKDGPPFIVHTEKLDITVTGTAFNVYARPDQTSVMLNHGSVNVHFKNSQTSDRTLRPEEILTFHNDGRWDVQPADTFHLSSWTGNRFVFYNTPLPELARTLTNYYGVEVVLKDSSLHRMAIYAEMSKPDLPTMITVLENALQINIEQQGRQLIFRKP